LEDGAEPDHGKAAGRVGAGDLVYNTSGATGASVVISEATETILHGVVKGTVSVTDIGYEERIEPFSAPFRIVVPPDHQAGIPGSFGTAYRCTIP